MNSKGEYCNFNNVRSGLVIHPFTIGPYSEGILCLLYQKRIISLTELFIIFVIMKELNQNEQRK